MHSHCCILLYWLYIAILAVNAVYCCVCCKCYACCVCCTCCKLLCLLYCCRCCIAVDAVDAVDAVLDGIYTGAIHGPSLTFPPKHFITQTLHYPSTLIIIMDNLSPAELAAHEETIIEWGDIFAEPKLTRLQNRIEELETQAQTLQDRIEELETQAQAFQAATAQKNQNYQETILALYVFFYFYSLKTNLIQFVQQKVKSKLLD